MINRVNVEIHSTAIVDEHALIGENCKIGPYCFLDKNVKLGKGNTLHSHVVIKGNTSIGDNNEFFQFGSIGEVPQDISYKGEDTKLIIGNDNTFREGVTLNIGTMKQDGVTQIGDRNLLMAYVHVGHDTIIMDDTIISNSVNLAGHVKVESKAILGGGCGVSQFISVGESAYIGGMSAIDKDVPCFCTGYGNRIKLRGVNIVGMKRAGYSKTDISEFVDFFRTLESSALAPRSYIKKASNRDELYSKPLIKKFIDFIESSEVGIAPYN